MRGILKAAAAALFLVPTMAQTAVFTFDETNMDSVGALDHDSVGNVGTIDTGVEGYGYGR